ncbi:MAG: hypothetical protein Kow0069_25780 [Promethearchaeota archaeon]
MSESAASLDGSCVKSLFGPGSKAHHAFEGFWRGAPGPRERVGDWLARAKVPGAWDDGGAPRAAYLAFLAACLLAKRGEGARNDRSDLISRCLGESPAAELFEGAERARRLVLRGLERRQCAEFVDFFGPLHHACWTPAQRRPGGQFFTPPALARAMVDDIYGGLPGQPLLDPACGSGAFLVEALRRIAEANSAWVQGAAGESGALKACSEVAGADADPLACLLTRANLVVNGWELLRRAGSPPEENTPPWRVVLSDALFPEARQVRILGGRKLLVGNPPWLVLNGIPSREYKERVKALAADVGLATGAENVANLELAALFFRRGAELYLEVGGVAFFVATAGLVSGSQHANFRALEGFVRPSLWTFRKDHFRVHAVCLRVERADPSRPAPLGERARVEAFPARISGGVVELGEAEAFVPYNREELLAASRRGEALPVARWIPERLVTTLLPRGSNHYRRAFRKGADLVPRALLFVQPAFPGTVEAGVVDVTPDPTLSRAKPPWDLVPFESARVEARHLFAALRSSELLPFFTLPPKTAFLPARHGALEGGGRRAGFEVVDPRDLSEHARRHWRLLEEIYRSRKKVGASAPSLWSAVNFRRKLAVQGTFRSNGPGDWLVVYPENAGACKSAAVRPRRPGELPLVVDYTLFWTRARSEGEARFLAAVLNAPSASRDLRLRGSTGAGGSLKHLEKRPLDYPVPKYDPRDRLHRKISNAARECERTAEEAARRWVDGEAKRTGVRPSEVVPRPRALQNAILRALRRRLEELDGNFLELLERGARR